MHTFSLKTIDQQNTDPKTNDLVNPENPKPYMGFKIIPYMHNIWKSSILKQSWDL